MDTLDECIQLCNALKRELENDCCVPPGSLGGNMLPAYEEVRESQLNAVREISKRMSMLKNLSPILK